MLKPILGAILACCILLGGSLMDKPGLKVRPSSEIPQEQAPTVAVAKARRQALRDDITFSGELRAYQQIDLYAKVPGFVREIRVDIGDLVRAGQQLATLEIPNLEQDIARAQANKMVAVSNRERMKAEYGDAHSQYLRMEQVAHDSPNLLAQQDIDDARAKDTAASAGLDEGASREASAQADLDRLINTRRLCAIMAPFDGTVTKRYSDAGSLVRGGDAPSAPAVPLIRLSQLDLIRLVFPVQESQSAMIRIGQAIEIHLPSLDRTLEAAVTRFTHHIDADTRTMEVECDLPNPDYAMIPGMFATVKLSKTTVSDAVTVPVQAIIRHGGDATAMVLDKDDQVIERKIRIGLETAEVTQILSGIAVDELVVTANQQQLHGGTRVSPHLIPDLISPP